MTDPRGFLQIQRRLAPLPPGRASASATTASSTRTRPRASCASRPSAAWTAACRSATRAARSRT